MCVDAQEDLSQKGGLTSYLHFSAQCVLGNMWMDKSGIDSFASHIKDNMKWFILVEIQNYEDSKTETFWLRPTNIFKQIGNNWIDWKSSAHECVHKDRMWFSILQLHKNALYWCDATSVASTQAVALKTNWWFQPNQQKCHTSPQTSKTILINLLTTTENGLRQWSVSYLGTLLRIQTC